MSLYFKLETGEYKGEECKIGDIMMQFNKALHDLTGLDLCLCNAPIDEALKQYYYDNNLAPVNEEILWKNMNDDEKCTKIMEYLNKILVNGDELLVIDPYIFSNSDESYENMLINIFNKSNYRNITVITNFYNTDKEFLKYIQENVPRLKKIKYTKDFHDRFWIADNKKGFVLGTSLNGVGKKYCYIDYLDNDDVSEIVSIVKNI